MVATELRYAIAACVVALLACVGVARADDATGRVSGVVETRTNYYWENSTRVVAPVVSTQLDTARGVRVDAYYLVDAITSASVGAGAQTDVRFTEIRNEFGVGPSYEFHLRNGNMLRAGGFFRYSREPDYRSYGAIPSLSLYLRDRSTILRFRGVFMHDDVGQRLRTGGGAAPTAGGGSTADAFSKSFNSVLASLSWEQTLSPRSILTLGYDFGYLQGFLSSPYRSATVGGVLLSENHPDVRIRNNVWARLQYAFPRSGTAIHLLFRSYLDSWDLAAITPEVRLYQELGSNLMVRLRYRYYQQTPSYFWSGNSTFTYANPQTYVTGDPKMTPFHVHESGIQLVYFLPDLDRKGLGWLSHAQLELTFDWRFNTNLFGDGVISTCAIRIPFR